MPIDQIGSTPARIQTVGGDLFQLSETARETESGRRPVSAEFFDFEHSAAYPRGLRYSHLWQRKSQCDPAKTQHAPHLSRRLRRQALFFFRFLSEDADPELRQQLSASRAKWGLLGCILSSGQRTEATLYAGISWRRTLHGRMWATRGTSGTFVNRCTSTASIGVSTTPSNASRTIRWPNILAAKSRRMGRARSLQSESRSNVTSSTERIDAWVIALQSLARPMWPVLGASSRAVPI